MEKEVFRLNTFTDGNYAFALKTRTDGVWPNQKHYTTHNLQYLGKHVKSARWDITIIVVVQKRLMIMAN